MAEWEVVGEDLGTWVRRVGTYIFVPLQGVGGDVVLLCILLEVFDEGGEDCFEVFFLASFGRHCGRLGEPRTLGWMVVGIWGSKRSSGASRGRRGIRYKSMAEKRRFARGRACPIGKDPTTSRQVINAQLYACKLP